MDGYRKNGVEWLEESNRQMISERYDQSKSNSTIEQPKDGEEEGGDDEQMPTAVKSAAIAASKLYSQLGDMWYMFANEIAKDISGQLDRLLHERVITALSIQLIDSDSFELIQFTDKRGWTLNF